MSIRSPFAVALLSLACVAPLASLAACTSLTTPPEPEEVAGETASTAPSSLPSAQFRGAHAPSASAAAPAAPSGPEGKLDIAEVAPGKGTPAKPGDQVFVNYIGKLTDGKEFDRSKGKPFSFKLGAGNVIKGWDQGLVGMKPGQKRKLTIPASLAYGARGYPPVIPPNSTLVFDVEMVDIKPGQ
ncbi:MAG: FKBP-type peptidyl-prolyl cis-trans isomerase [Polyangiaceae bacterium]